MLMSRDEASRQVRMTVASESNRYGVSMAADAIEFLSTVPRDFAGGGSIDIDVNELRRAIRDIIAAMESQGVRRVDGRLIALFLASWQCHYLWFC
jgi:hypothetical protein